MTTKKATKPAATPDTENGDQTEVRMVSPPALKVEGVPHIYTAMAAIMRDVEAIGKSKRNEQQGFNYRGVDQAYNSLHPMFAKHSVITVPRVLSREREERTTRNGGLLIYTLIMMEFDFISTIDGSQIRVGPMLGEGMDSADKSGNKAEAVAHKYALLQTLMIPTEDMPDPDADTHEVMPRGATAAVSAKPAGAPAAQAAPAPQPAPPPAAKPAPVPPAPNESVAGKMPTELPTEQDAANTVDILLQVAKMEGNTVDGLRGAWGRNKHVIDVISQKYPTQYERMKTAFAQMNAALAEKAKQENGNGE